MAYESQGQYSDAEGFPDGLADSDTLEFPPLASSRPRRRTGAVIGGALLGIGLVAGPVIGDEMLDGGSGVTASASWLHGHIPHIGGTAGSSATDGRAQSGPAVSLPNGAAANSSVHASPAPKQKTVESCIASLPLDMRLGQTLIIGVQGDGLAQDQYIFSQKNIGGAIIMSKPANPDDGSILQFKKAAKIPVLIGSDEEGGARTEGGVQRFRDFDPSSNTDELPLADTAAKTEKPAQLQQQIATYAKQLHDIGVDTVYGPVADVRPADGQGPLPGRMYGSDPQVVTEFDQAAIKGWQQGGVLPTMKHFPGLGTADGNTDYKPATTAPLAQLQQRDLLPYKNLHASGAAVMVGSQVVPGLTNGLPANQSKAALSLLRDSLGWKDALVVTDSLSAAAIPDAPKAAASAIEAGVDMAMIVSPAKNTTMSQEIDTTLNVLKQAVDDGSLPASRLDAAVAHVLNAKGVDPFSLCR